MNPLVEQHCTPHVRSLDDIEIQKYRSEIHPDWLINSDRCAISREIKLKDYDETIALVNAVAVIAIRQDHHPDISFGYNNCKIIYSTHSVGGLSLNDFICAARIDAIRQK